MTGLHRFAALIAVVFALQACTSTEATLDPGAVQQTPPAAAAADASQPASDQAGAVPSPAGAGAGAQQPTSGAQVSALASQVRVHLAPVVGTTVEAARPLSQQMEARGTQLNVDFRGQGAENVRYILKGYFSALSEEKQTLVIYVWDVLDPAGNRLHRIQGQEKAPAGGADPWTSVPASTMQAIADKTVDQLAAWLATQTG